MKLSRRTLALCAGAALVAGSLSGVAHAAGTKSIAYYMPGDGFNTAYLVDWQPKNKARVASPLGAQTGTVLDNGTQKLVTLGSPLSVTYAFVDDCNQDIQQRQDTKQVVVRDVAGSMSQVVEIGTITNIGGCQDGLVTPFGSPDDAGASMKRLAMTARPPMTDLVPGSRMAGPREEPAMPNEYAAQDVITLQAGTALFQTSGHSVPAAFTPDGWLVLSLAGFDRAYTRLEIDAKTGGEFWLDADWSAGQVQRVEKATFVKPVAGAGFGTKTEASRMWQSGIFIATRKPFFIYLYKNGTGERVSKDLDLGTEFRQPISWGFDGLNIVQTRQLSDSIHFDRTWTPLRNEGKAHWVMESELLVDGTDVFINIKPRVNYYLDTGKAVPPANAGQPSRGMVYLGEAPKLAR